MPGRSSKAGRSNPPSPEANAIERLLVELPELELLGILQGASNYTFLAQLGPHPPTGLRVVYNRDAIVDHLKPGMTVEAWQKRARQLAFTEYRFYDDGRD